MGKEQAPETTKRRRRFRKSVHFADGFQFHRADQPEGEAKEVKETQKRPAEESKASVSPPEKRQRSTRRSSTKENTAPSAAPKATSRSRSSASKLDNLTTEQKSALKRAFAAVVEDEVEMCRKESEDVFESVKRVCDKFVESVEKMLGETYEEPPQANPVNQELQRKEAELRRSNESFDSEIDTLNELKSHYLSLLEAEDTEPSETLTVEDGRFLFEGEELAKKESLGKLLRDSLTDWSIKLEQPQHALQNLDKYVSEFNVASSKLVAHIKKAETSAYENVNDAKALIQSMSSKPEVAAKGGLRV